MLFRFSRLMLLRSSLTAAAVVAAGQPASFAQAPTGTTPCATGSAYFVDNVQSHQAVSSPFSAIFYATTAKGCTLTAVRLYIDDKAYLTYPVDQPGGTLGGSNFQPISASDGYHKFVGVAWNQDGFAFRTQDFPIFVANEDQTVYVTAPGNGAALPDSTVNFDLHTRWDVTQGQNYGSQVTHLRIYVDNQDVYDTDGTYAQFAKTLPSGNHYLVAIAWNQYGSYIKGVSNFIVK